MLPKVYRPRKNRVYVTRIGRRTQGALISGAATLANDCLSGSDALTA